MGLSHKIVFFNQMNLNDIEFRNTFAHDHRVNDLWASFLTRDIQLPAKFFRLLFLLE